MHACILLLSFLFVIAVADLEAVHEKAITMKVKSLAPLITDNGYMGWWEFKPDTISMRKKKKRGALTIKIPSPTTIWHRTFKDGREKQYMESCTPGLDVCNKWRSGILGKDVHPEKISLAKDGTLNMPKVTSADSAQYYTYYLGKDGVFHYTYFDVIVA